MRSIRSDQQTGELRLIRFLEEFASIEEELKVELLPRQVRDLARLTKFTQEEHNEYKLKHCYDKNNKRFGSKKRPCSATQSN